jgi:two-component system, OmpR family, response regulator
MRILIVEDEHKIANALKRGLAQESFAVDIAYDGDEGLASAQSEPYDVIVLDRMLPGVDGITMCKQLRAEGNHTPIIMLTAKDQVRDRVQGLDAGADDYLVKPFSFEELLARIRALLRRPHEAASSVLEVDDLRLNPATFAVTRKGQPIALSGKEFALLEYLMRNAGRIVTKDMIMGHVWDFDADILPNTVEVYIGYLRNKIEKPFTDSPRLIYTHRGFGYKMGVQ